MRNIYCAAVVLFLECSLIYAVSNVTPTLSECSKEAIGNCLRNITAFDVLPWQNNSDDVDLVDACSALDLATECYNRELSYCEDKYSLVTNLFAMYTYVCTSEGRKDYKIVRQCFDQQEALSFMSKCRNTSGINLFNPCSVPNQYMNCAKEALRKFCNSSPALSKIVKAYLAPYLLYNCEFSNTNTDTTDGKNSNPPYTVNFLILTALMLVTAFFI